MLRSLNRICGRGGQIMTEKQNSAQGRITISTTISRENYDKIKTQCWHYNELITMGMQAKEDMPCLLARIGILEEGNRKLQAKLTQIYQLQANV